ncbi:MAG: translation initiation factor IF-2 [Spirochaetales bacterium]|jgi:translation initiation factor IF-2|nr:translation initiation factor IF-2 [Spirochaetales bacterium]
MSDEQEKSKLKTTLIKHKKDEAPTPKTADDEKEKKKVVVVKKKVVVKKAGPWAAPKPVSSGEEPAPAPTPVPKTEPEPVVNLPVTETAVPAPPRGPEPRPRPREQEHGRGYTRGESYQPRPPRTDRPFPGRGEGRSDNRPFYYRDNRPGFAGREGNRDSGRFPAQRGPRPAGQGYGGRAPAAGSGYARPPRTGQGGPGAGRPPFGGNRNRPATGTGAPVAKEKKPVSKKFFKTKKKDYPKRDKVIEKEILQTRKKTVTRTNPVPKQIDIMEVITVSELARKMNLKASDLIAKLMAMGMMVTINQQIDVETAQILASEYECKVNIVSLYDETIIESSVDREEDLEPRPPIITIMGHVDHGKTKLLDAIRSSDVAGGEFGGITQHIGAYTVGLPQGKITVLDTPGHEAFTMMRARGAQITDIVILVVAANDGVMPQTIEAINHAKEANVPIIVAINKIDLPEANPDRVKQQLSEYDLIPDEWGGKTLYAEISALKKTGIDELLEAIILQAEMLDLKASYRCKAEGKIIESKIDQGRGIIATVLIEKGTLRVGDDFVAGIYHGRVRAMFNDRGERLEEATPSMPVEALGFTGIPNAGDPFQVTESEKFARQIGDKRQELRRLEESRNLKKITLDNLYDSIKEGAIQELKVIIKGDVHGSVEALKTSLEKLSTNEIRLNVIQALAGAINEGDIRLASASDAIIIGFHVRPTPKAQQLADTEKVEIRKYNIIYDATEDIRSAMEGLLAPDLKEETIGLVEVRDTFKVPKIGLIAGCYVTSGIVKRNAQVHLIREGIEVFTGKIVSLKRFKDDAREVATGFECGIGLENFNDIKVGDQFEIFEIREIAKKLGEPVNG